VNLSPDVDGGLAVLIAGLALWTIAVRDTFAAVIGFVAFGLVVAVAWMRLAAPDVALTEAAIGSGITGGLLITAAAGRRRRPPPQPDGRPRGIVRIAAATASVLAAVGLGVAVLSLPTPAPTLAPNVALHLGLTGLANPVNAVLLGFRAVDTLLEVFVLLLALLGVWSLAPDRFWGGRPGAAQRVDPHAMLVFVARLLPPLGIVVGLHLLWVGAVAPGGEFQSATVLAAVWILATTAGLCDWPPVGKPRLRLVLVIGTAVFLAIGLAGLVIAGAFLAYPPAYAKLLIVAIELPLTLSIAAILGLLVAGPPSREPRR
jgi:multisubunit Na+/H+ antiporter MnhB subunit